ncbi:ACT domain-containing protein [Salisediminibacterium halotolerans]|uniref:ACT domain-containing protein n=1 Tax=Salisediminibacterium halotolerans TaxID=517425 RepID=UPI000EAC3E57|nr:ACT domain-containing protein [Salisediminibacterium halotolerans]RLJ81049.1 ACT domain-containing protein [Actinophytocola xinjiangensis]RPE87861.1 ACT domain-containing protein [Salisediminibacterium halotolerans]TWG37942.1 ACT domain-containing protein [Salisediminibacterium halotolerans]GEL08825.1 UPF0237 protein [Salisediminibacterium halotolerans]
MEQQRAVITVVGKDQVGIIAKVTTALADNQLNVLDISQTILQDFFTMMMIVDLSRAADLEKLQADLEKIEQDMQLQIDMQREDIFQSMHRI